MNKLIIGLPILLLLLVPFACAKETTPAPAPTSQVVGELKLEGIGNVNIGPGITGQINGGEYLFLAKSAESVTGEPGILVFDIRNPTSPKETANVPTHGAVVINGLVLSDKLLYLSAFNSLWILDVANPSAPREITRLTDIRAFGVAVSGQYAYVMKNGGQGITVLSVADPAHPQVAGNITVQSSYLKASGSLLFAYEPGLHIIDISSPTSFKEQSYIPTTGQARFFSGVRVYRVINPGFSDIAIKDQYVYIASVTEGMKVLDVSEPSVPREIATYQIPEQEAAFRIFISDNRAYLITGATVYILDISNPEKPKKLDSMTLTPNNYRSEFAVAGTYLYAFINSRPPSIEIIGLASE